MAVSCRLEGYGYRLRPVELDDASRLLKLRTDPKLGKFLNFTPNDLAVQQGWIEEQRCRAGDYYFVVETMTGGFDGTIGLYGVAEGNGEWGRWVLRRGSLGAPASVLLLLGFGFEQLGLVQAYCQTLEKNVSVVKFHDACGYSSRSLISDLSGREFVKHELGRAHWSAFRAKLALIAEKVARRLGELN